MNKLYYLISTKNEHFIISIIHAEPKLFQCLFLPLSLFLTLVCVSYLNPDGLVINFLFPSFDNHHSPINITTLDGKHMTAGAISNYVINMFVNKAKQILVNLFSI